MLYINRFAGLTVDAYFKAVELHAYLQEYTGHKPSTQKACYENNSEDLIVLESPLTSRTCCWYLKVKTNAWFLLQRE